VDELPRKLKAIDEILDHLADASASKPADIL
jgi:hypothetical protein